MSDGPRIPPGTPRDIGPVATVISRVAGRALGTGPPNVFTTLGRHRRLFLPWLRFAGRLMPRGKLPRRDTELVILRVAHRTGCKYEWNHHQRIGRRVGLSADEIERVRHGPDAPEWTARQALLLHAVDELHEQRDICDETWTALRGQMTDVELIELCMLTGHYEMLAMTLNSLRVEPER